MTVSDNTIKADGLGYFFQNLGKISAKAGEKLAKNVISNPGRALDLTAKTATAATTKSPKAALSTLPEVINFYHTGKGLYLGKFVEEHHTCICVYTCICVHRCIRVIFNIHKWNKKQIDCIPVLHY